MPERDVKKKDIIDGGENINRDWFENTVRKEYKRVIEKPEPESIERKSVKK